MLLLQFPAYLKFTLLALILITITLVLPSPSNSAQRFTYTYNPRQYSLEERIDDDDYGYDVSTGTRKTPKVLLEDDGKDPQFDETVLFIGILSAPTADSAERRQGIRESWLKYPYVKRRNVLYKFFLGHGSDERLNQKVREENDIFGDIYINNDIEESYFNITRKVRDIYFYLESFKGSVPFALKTDDDTFNSVRSWVDHLRELEVGPTYTIGQLATGARPIRDENSPWYASPSDYPGEKYPPFNFGAAYAFNYPMAKYLKEDYEGDHHVNIFKLEDVWSGIVGEHYEEDTGVTIKRIRVPVNTGSGCKDGLYSQHYAKSPTEMKNIWKTSKDSNRIKCR